MEKIWLKSYPPGVPAEIDATRIRSLNAVIEQSLAKYADRDGVRADGTVHHATAELDSLTRDFAAWLQNEAGLKKGDASRIMLPNVLQYPIAMFGVLRAGSWSSTPIRCTPRAELEHQLKDSGAKAIVILENFAHGCRR